MGKIDLIVLVVYLLSLLFLSLFFSRIKDTKEMFAAGGTSPWWLSGLSAFMTTFSAGTFVIWGGIAYRFGLVGVSILMVIGISALFVGWFIASRWRELGYDSAAEFINARFGKSLVRFYTVIQALFLLITMGGAVYALSVIVTALVPLPPEYLLADPATGHLSITFTSLVICLIVIAITFGGGLWAVLITDAIQFIILSASILIIVPLILIRVGGFSGMIDTAPSGFFEFVNKEFNWYFLFGWGVVFFFKIGGEWAYVQRFVSVPTAKDARKSSILLGILYIVSPIIWLLPPMAYRFINPNANYEEAYILASQEVLPPGMLGLMVAAMCSATASMATTQLNVFAGAFTSEFYKRIFRPQASNHELIKAGRIITLILGGVIIAGALLIPVLGTYTGFILASTSILEGPLILPTIWGLYSKKIGLKTAWVVSALGIAFGLSVKVGFISVNWINTVIDHNERVLDIILGTVFPLVLLIITEVFSKKMDAGWSRVLISKDNYSKTTKPAAHSLFPAKLLGWSTAFVGFGILIISWLTTENIKLLFYFGLGILVLGIGIVSFKTIKGKVV